MEAAQEPVSFLPSLTLFLLVEVAGQIAGKDSGLLIPSLRSSVKSLYWLDIFASRHF